MKIQEIILDSNPSYFVQSLDEINKSSNKGLTWLKVSDDGSIQCIGVLQKIIEVIKGALGYFSSSFVDHSNSSVVELRFIRLLEASRRNPGFKKLIKKIKSAALRLSGSETDRHKELNTIIQKITNDQFDAIEGSSSQFHKNHKEELPLVLRNIEVFPIHYDVVTEDKPLDRPSNDSTNQNQFASIRETSLKDEPDTSIERESASEKEQAIEQELFQATVSRIEITQQSFLEPVIQQPILSDVDESSNHPTSEEQLAEKDEPKPAVEQSVFEEEQPTVQSLSPVSDNDAFKTTEEPAIVLPMQMTEPVKVNDEHGSSGKIKLADTSSRVSDLHAPRWIGLAVLIVGIVAWQFKNMFIVNQSAVQVSDPVDDNNPYTTNTGGRRVGPKQYSNPFREKDGSCAWDHEESENLHNKFEMNDVNNQTDNDSVKVFMHSHNESRFEHVDNRTYNNLTDNAAGNENALFANKIKIEQVSNQNIESTDQGVQVEGGKLRGQVNSINPTTKGYADNDIEHRKDAEPNVDPAEKEAASSTSYKPLDEKIWADIQNFKANMEILSRKDFYLNKNKALDGQDYFLNNIESDLTKLSQSNMANAIICYSEILSFYEGPLLIADAFKLIQSLKLSVLDEKTQLEAVNLLELINTNNMIASIYRDYNYAKEYMNREVNKFKESKFATVRLIANKIEIPWSRWFWSLFGL